MPVGLTTRSTADLFNGYSAQRLLGSWRDLQRLRVQFSGYLFNTVGFEDRLVVTNRSFFGRLEVPNDRAQRALG
ncbi:MAG: hypothetical protein ACK46L_12000 [Synechococcaceae cyanobacterium]